MIHFHHSRGIFNIEMWEYCRSQLKWGRFLLIASYFTDVRSQRLDDDAFSSSSFSPRQWPFLHIPLEIVSMDYEPHTVTLNELFALKLLVGKLHLIYKNKMKWNENAKTVFFFEIFVSVFRLEHSYHQASVERSKSIMCISNGKMI